MKQPSSKVFYGMMIAGIFASALGDSVAQQNKPTEPKAPEPIYKLVRKITGSNDSYSMQVMLRNLPAFTCAIKVVETASYHKGLIDGAKQAGGECHNVTHENKQFSVTVRVENCEDPNKWMSTEYVCEEEPVEPSEEKNNIEE